MSIEYRTERINIAIEPSLGKILRDLTNTENMDMSPYLRGLMIDDFLKRGLLSQEQLRALVK